MSLCLPIKRHLDADALKFTTFHGDNRAKKLEDLAGQDAVLTTYPTLLSDWKGRKLLQSLAWFRIVLDEGKKQWFHNVMLLLMRISWPPLAYFISLYL